MIRLLLVDDLSCVREGLRMRLALEPDLVVVGEASDGAQALALSREQTPDVVVMDIRLPVMDGIAATATLRDLAPRSAVVVHSLYEDAALRARARAAGACTFVGKHEGTEALVAAIRRAVPAGGAPTITQVPGDENARPLVGATV